MTAHLRGKPASPTSGVQAACLAAVTEEPGSTSSDVRAELLGRGIVAATAVVSTALARLVEQGLLVRQEMHLDAPTSRRGTSRVVLCYRPVPPTEPTP